MEKNETHPPSASYSGMNLHSVQCDVHGLPFSYSSCLRFIATAEQSEPGDDRRSKCKQAIAAGTCPALGMRAEEKKAGRAIYIDLYHPRKHTDEDFRRRSETNIRGSVADYARGYSAGWSKVGQEMLGEKKPAPETIKRPVVIAPNPSKSTARDDGAYLDEDRELMSAVTKVAEKLRTTQQESIE